MFLRLLFAREIFHRKIHPGVYVFAVIIVIISSGLRFIGISSHENPNSAYESRIQAAKDRIENIDEAIVDYHETTGKNPNTIEDLEDFGILEIDDELMKFWEFEIEGYNEIVTITASSTKYLSGKQVKIISFDRFSKIMTEFEEE